MGEGEKRSLRRVPTAPSRLSEKLGAAGSPADEDAPSMPRTTTLDDPLTTSLLAEVARRSRTLDVSPEQIAEAQDLDVIDPLDDQGLPPGGSAAEGRRGLIDELVTTPIAAPAAAAALGSTRIPRGASSAGDPDDPA